MIKLLAIGDVTSPRAAEALAASLWEIRKKHGVDFVSVNAENAGFIMGPTPEVAHLLLNAGADVLTGGNHILQNQFLHGMLENDTRVLRPANYPAAAPGAGYTLSDVRGYRLLTVNVMGRVHMEPPLDSPFEAVEHILKREKDNYDLAILDIHAEATGEKVALAHYFDGRFAAIFGTHTHVPTADCRILPKGTGYVTDLGMCGADNGILGIAEEAVMKRYLTGISSRFSPADGSMFADGVLFTVEETGRCLSVERLRFSLA